MQYVLDNHVLNVLVLRKPNKNIYMRFKDQNTILVTCNRFVSEKEILHILNNNQSSLLKMYLKKVKEEEKDSFFFYLGKAYTTVFDGVSKSVYFESDCLFVKDEKTLNKFYQKECLRVFQSEIERIVPYFKNIPKFSLKIRKMKTRWGVNNLSNKTITLNSDLLKKDLDLLDYVIIHELCHFYEANHSSKFWDRVSEYYPNYKEARRRLKE